jgi:hypothetical protein
MFWTLGGNQVGKAALSGWQEIVVPSIARGAPIWPFSGDLDLLGSDIVPVIAETYPAEAYGHIGLRFTSGESKRRMTDRVSKAGGIFSWAHAQAVKFSDDVELQIRSGFGSDDQGEDRFDALVGLLGMIAQIISGAHQSAPTGPAVRSWEGWILGQAAPAPRQGLV